MLAVFFVREDESAYNVLRNVLLAELAWNDERLKVADELVSQFVRDEDVKHLCKQEISAWNVQAEFNGYLDGNWVNAELLQAWVGAELLLPLFGKVLNDCEDWILENVF